jgi:uncharacterized protein YeaC (DUF1315 family)
VLDVIFCSTLHSGGNMVMETTENVDEMGFFTRQKVAAMATKPEAVFEKILDAWEKGSWPHGSYLGTYG